MKAKCISNNGNGLLKTTIEYTGDSEKSIYPLKEGEVYTIYGQIIYKNVLKYLILGSYENLPSWYPAELFEIVDTSLHFEWYFNSYPTEDISAVWGFKELVNDLEFLDELIDREDSAIRIFLLRKKEIDEFCEKFSM